MTTMACYNLGYEHACYLWRRAGLEPVPQSIEQVAEALEDMGIRVYDVVNAGFMEDRAGGIRCGAHPRDIFSTLLMFALGTG